MMKKYIGPFSSQAAMLIILLTWFLLVIFRITNFLLHLIMYAQITEFVCYKELIKVFIF